MTISAPHNILGRYNWRSNLKNLIHMIASQSPGNCDFCLEGQGRWGTQNMIASREDGARRWYDHFGEISIRVSNISP
jgi:hypothetical protein